MPSVLSVCVCGLVLLWSLVLTASFCAAAAHNGCELLLLPQQHAMAPAHGTLSRARACVHLFMHMWA